MTRLACWLAVGVLTLLAAGCDSGETDTSLPSHTPNSRTTPPSVAEPLVVARSDPPANRSR